ncbi:hypothetical protein PMM47T1_10480 [Pseudomonas sp. M47T1]|uniref:chalcone isomerase family protein n=1 Tax=unclassified Pseudomonas TaxID=196821 RepID=UPI0002607873|nr:chalcone isomerase family protein [Pseudomonas sp. M47T1]EIK96693.1 hypothetical protein PMM47T1_10480 [Pseudomonas sp. M47T1]
MRHKPLLLLLFFCTLAWGNTTDRLREANFAEQWGQTPTLQRKSQALLNYLFVDVYAAAFYAEAGTSAQQAVDSLSDQRLELFYFHDIGRDDVIKAANQTLQRQASPNQLRAAQAEIDRLHRSYVDIHAGDRYALVYNTLEGLSVERNGQVIFVSKDKDLARLYLNIWLAPKGLSDNLREALLLPGAA